MKIFKKALRVILIILPGIIGFYGFMQIKGLGITWGIYHTLRLYSFNTPLLELNPYIEIARWLAPLATAGIFVILFQTLQNNLRKLIVMRRRESCSVYGDGEDAKNLLADLGKAGIAGTDRILNTKYHVILFENEHEGLRFFNRHEKELLKGKVYLALDKIPSRSIQKNGMVAFSMSENCGTTYWLEHPVTKHEKIAIIGNAGLPDALLTKGLLLNIVDVNQEIQYHIWNNNDDYSKLHTRIDAIGLDKIIFHKEDSNRDINLLETMDRIILCGSDEDNIARAAELLEYTNKPNIYLRVRNQETAATFFSNDKVVTFGQSKRLATKNIIINEALLDEAKKLHQHYTSLYGGPSWENLEEFKKRSNISSAEYHKVLQRLHHDGVALEKLAELEHVRWCRFHYLNNWQYGEILDKDKRTHNLLVDYRDLKDEEKQKDREVVEMALRAIR